MDFPSPSAAPTAAPKVSHPAYTNRHGFPSAVITSHHQNCNNGMLTHNRTTQDNPSFNEDTDLRAKLAHQATTLLNQSDPVSTGEPRDPHQPAPSHGYAQSSLNPQSQIHPHLRAASTAATSPEIMASNFRPTSPHSGSLPSASSAMTVHGLLDPEPDDSTPDGRKAKRELSQSKRAAQNRAAQRAFRQRKEHYIKKLEQQVREYTDMEHNYKAFQNENYALREYVIQLQSRMIDSQVEVPQPPPNLNISPPAPSAARPAPPNLPAPAPAPGPAPVPVPVPAPESASVPSSLPASGSADSLADVAAAVAGLRAREPGREAAPDGAFSSRVKPETSEERSDDELRRQLQRDTTMSSSSSLRV